MTTERKVILSKPGDWDSWIAIIQMRAETLLIWDKINPDQDAATILPALEQPVAPRLVIPLDGLISQESLAIHKALKENHKADKEEFEKEIKGFSEIISLIQATVTVSNLTYIERKGRHPYHSLVALKSKLAPTNQARLMEFEKEFARLNKGPGKGDLDKWIDDWVKMYNKGKQYDMAETVGNKPIRHFLVAIKGINPYFSNERLTVLTLSDETMDVLKTVEAFRQVTRMTDAKTLSSSHSAFSADDNNPNSSSDKSSDRPSFRGRSRSRSQRFKPTCICGAKEYYSECPYLNSDRRSSTWKPDPDTKKKVETAMKNQETKEKVEYHIERNRLFQKQKEMMAKEKAKENAKEESKAESPTKYDAGSFAASSFNFSTMTLSHDLTAFSTIESSFASDRYPLQSSWILDNGSNVHICNNTMSHRFQKERDGNGRGIIAGSQILSIEAYGKITIEFETDDGVGTMTLLNVCYIPTFMTNVVSNFILYKKGLHFDTYNTRLHKAGETVGYARPRHEHFVLEDNIDGGNTRSAFATMDKTPTKSGTAKDWHNILAHASGEVIQHLEQAADGVKVSDDIVPKTNECETCALSKSHQLISRSPDKSETSDKPFHRISFDLIPLNAALNRDKWISHFACCRYDFNMVYTHPKKSDATSLVRKVLNVICTRFNGVVVFFRSDGEKALGIEFLDILAEKGITWEPSAPYTPQQNGHSERKGGLLTMKARALRIGAGLPNFLWPWIYQCSGYLMNRTPMKKHGWRTPWEMITKQKPNLSHLHKYGCKAYALDKLIPKKDKLRERAHVGILLGYDSTNIFMVWIPSQKKVVRVRDVIFDENSKYDPSELDIGHILKEPMSEDTYEVLTPPDIRVTEVTDSETDDEVDKESKLWQPGNSKEKGKEKEVEEVRSDTSISRTPIYTPRTASPDAHLPSPVPTLPETNDADDVPSSSLSLRPIPSASRTRAPRDIVGDFTEDNILPEGVTRTRRRRHAHAVDVEKVRSGDDIFHQAFSAFLPSRNYYKMHQEIKISTSPKDHTRLHRDNLPPEPLYYRHMLKHPHRRGFEQALEAELSQLKSMKVWLLSSKEECAKDGKVPIPLTWVFKYKFDDDGYLIKYRSRLCARGDLQSTYQDTYAATLAIRIFRALMAIVAAFDLETRQYDAVNAFVNSDIDEPTYCMPPDGWSGPSDILLLLLKALYGLKQSPALWFRNLSQTLMSLGLEPVPGVECLFVSEFMILFFFVDDIVVIFDKRHTKEIDEFQASLFKKYQMKYLGEVQWFLGIRISRNRSLKKLSLCQDSYIEKLITKFKINTDIKAPATPLHNYEDLRKNTGTASADQILCYQQKVGSINFSAVNTRPDTSFSASKLSEFLTNPSKEHQDAVDRVLRYLAHTKSYSIVFDPMNSDPKSIFLGSSDASFADDVDTRHSSQGYCFRLFGGLIDWKAFKQKTVTTSSTEAELLAISTASKELIWWTRFFESISFIPQDTTEIECDNKQTIRAFTNTSQFSTKLRHVDIHRHWLRQEVEKGSINIKWTPTTSIMADGLTKALSPQRHREFLRLLGMEEGQYV